MRAGLCAHPAGYPWSSFRINAEGATGGLVSPHEEFQRLGADDAERRAAYAKLFGSVLDARRLEEIRSATNGNFALGDAAFRRQLAVRVGRRVEPGSSGRPAGRQEKRGPSLFLE